MVSSLLAAQHVEGQGRSLFQAVCEADLEGMVGKWAQGRYICDGQRPSWVRIKGSGGYSGDNPAGYR
jgi:ATP-dependent DNA ligase